MKMPGLKFTKKSAIITVSVVSGLVIGGLGVSQSEAALDWLGVEQKLENHDEQLENHDARIENAEADINKLQDETNTTPSEDRQNVPAVITPNPELEQQEENSDSAPNQGNNEPVVVTAVAPIDLGGGNYNCKLTFSDETQKIRVWKRVSGNTTSTSGGCSDTLLGTLKSSN